MTHLGQKSLSPPESRLDKFVHTLHVLLVKLNKAWIGHGLDHLADQEQCSLRRHWQRLIINTMHLRLDNGRGEKTEKESTAN